MFHLAAANDPLFASKHQRLAFSVSCFDSGLFPG